MPRQVRIIALLVTAALLLITLFPRVAASRLPGDNQGYAPEQPIAYSHRLHAGELQIDCQYCHFAADRSRNAGIPPGNVCMNCHVFVTSSFGAYREEDRIAKEEGRKPRPVVSDDLQTLYDHMGLGPDLLTPDPEKTPTPIEWVRVHKLADFVFFDHSRHVLAGVICQECHGPVESMERVRQFSDLTMGWCVNCHRKVNEEGVSGKRVEASTDCGACHF